MTTDSIVVATARSRLFFAAFISGTLWKSFTYQSKVKLCQTMFSRDELNENTTSTTIGMYRKAKTSVVQPRRNQLSNFRPEGSSGLVAGAGIGKQGAVIMPTAGL